MRNVLLAGIAMLATTSGVTYAQSIAQTIGGLPPTSNPSQGQLALPAHSTSSTDNTTNNYVGQPDSFVGASERYVGSVAKPTPGTLVIKLNGKVEVDANAAWTSVSTSAPGPHGSPPAGAAKVNPITFGSFMRLYPGVDGMAANGLRYGAAVEIRENFPGSSAQPSPALSPAPSGSAYSSGETLFVRRAFTYMAADDVGMVRFGQTDGVIGLFDPCIYSAQCWDAGINNFNQAATQQPSGAVSLPFVWLAGAGAEYGNTKVVYLSPQFLGFDFGLQYAPNMNNGYSACGTSTEPGTTATTACASQTTGADATRWYNQVVTGVRYQGVWGPVVAGAYGIYETAGKESGPFVPAASLTTAARLGEATTALQYDNLNFGEAAGYLGTDTSFGRFVASLDWIGGALNGQLAMRPTGGVPENGVITGLLYNKDAVTLGIAYAVVNSQGAAQLTGVSQRRESGVAFGGNYALAPGLFLVGEYQYQQRHQGDYDFANNAVGTAANGLGTRDTHAQTLIFATVVNW